MTRLATNEIIPPLPPRGLRPLHFPPSQHDQGNGVPLEKDRLLDKLSAREHEVALLAAGGQTYKEIAAELNLSTSTIRTHLKNIYEKLGIQDKTGLAVLILSSNNGSLEGLDFSTLTPPELKVLTLLGAGLRNKQIGPQLGVAVSTVRTHQHSIKAKLGLIGDQGERAIVARAFGKKVSDIAIRIQPVVVETLKDIKKAHKEGKLDLNKTEAVHTIKNPPLLTILQERGYISHDMAESGNVNLGGLVVALLIKKSDTKDILLDPQTEFIVGEIIQQEVRLFKQNSTP